MINTMEGLGATEKVWSFIHCNIEIIIMHQLGKQVNSFSLTGNIWNTLMEICSTISLLKPE